MAQGSGRGSGGRRPPGFDEVEQARFPGLANEPGVVELFEEIRERLDRPRPWGLLAFTSSLLTELDPPRSAPFVPSGDDTEELSLDEILLPLLEIDRVETTALLTVLAELIPNQLLTRRIRKELADRGHRLPAWLTGLVPLTVERAVEMSHVLGDGDTLAVGARTPHGDEFAVVAYIDHNLGTVLKDAFVAEQSLAATVASLRAAASEDPDLALRDLDPADARTRITAAMERSAITWPPFETETWPACRPLVRWVVRHLPAGGRGYERPEWDEEDRAALAERFLASGFGAAHDHAEGRDLLDSLLWFACDYGPGDPLRWSPTAVEILLLDWLPRKIVAEVAHLDRAPDLLCDFVRFCHDQRDIRPALTEQTLAAVDRWEPDYRETIRSPRPQGVDALLDAMGVPAPHGGWGGGAGWPAADPLARLCAAVGGEEALAGLDTAPLPEEPFDWDRVPEDAHERVGEVLALTDHCCGALLDTEARTACRRLLADLAATDPHLLGRGRADTAAAAVVWVVARANNLFDSHGPGLKVAEVTDLLGLSGSPSQRGRTMLEALGGGTGWTARDVHLGTPRYLVAVRRRELVAARDRYEAAAAQDRDGAWIDDDDQWGYDDPWSDDPWSEDPWSEDPWGEDAPGERWPVWRPEAGAPVVGYVPADQFAESLERWPGLADRWGTREHGVYARLLQGFLLDLSTAIGRRPVLAPLEADGAAEEVADHAARFGLDPAGLEARTSLAAEMVERGGGVTWPPGRNDPCWCGQDRKYKKCCGSVAEDPARRGDPALPDPATGAYELEVSLVGVRPRIWRRLRVRASGSFLDLHRAIQHACGWTDAHMFAFRDPAGRPVAGVPYDNGFSPPDPDAAAVVLTAYFARHDRCTYEYDFGDGWVHEVVLRDRVRGTDAERRLVDGARAFPPEDCGGLPGYERCVEVATGGADPDGLSDWLGGWHPEAFDLEAVRARFDR